jgi:multidrug efflux system membrane fusion protein
MTHEEQPNITSEPTQTPSQRGILFYGVLCLLLIVFLIFLYWIFKPHKKIHITLPTTISVATAQSQDVPVYLTALGTVTPLETVTIKTQVNGVLDKVMFKEGQDVKKGQVIAQIFAEPFEAQLNQSKGALARDQALLENARLDLTRYQQLYKQDSTSKQVLDTQVSLVKQYEGAVKADQGLVQTSQVNLNFTKINSPINGRVGLRLVDPGNFVQTSDTSGLLVINTIHPINVVFTLAEDDIPKVLNKMKAKNSLIVEALNRSQHNLLATGKLASLDNQIDTTTGTVKLKGIFSNCDNKLFPNQFVNIRLMIDKLINAIVIPSQAVLHGTHGDYVYRFHPETGTVEMVSVTTGTVFGNYTVIKSGIINNDIVVTEGTDKLTQGTKVIVSNNNHGAPAVKNHESI